MRVGEVTTWERTFTEEDVHIFSGISGDRGIQHVQANEQGQLMVQGLLTATLPTKIGGDLNFMAREMWFEFHRPVFTGDIIRCEAVITEMTVLAEKVNLTSSFSCINQHGKLVLSGRAKGIVPKMPQGLRNVKHGSLNT